MSGQKNVAVFDTDVIVSGFLSPAGPPGRIVNWLRTGTVRAVVDDRIVAEYEVVLQRPKLHLPLREAGIVLRAILDHGMWADIEPRHVIGDLPDPDDALFAECAQALGCPLVTGNNRHFPVSIVPELTILSPREYLLQLTK